MKLADQLGNVTRRGFLSGTAGVIATSGAALPLSGEADHASSLEEMANALHDAVGRYCDQNTSFNLEACSLDRWHPLMYSMERLRDRSVDEIQHLLRPLYENIEGGAK